MAVAPVWAARVVRAEAVVMLVAMRWATVASAAFSTVKATSTPAARRPRPRRRALSVMAEMTMSDSLTYRA